MPSASTQVSSAARSSQPRPVRRWVKQPEKPVQASTSSSTSVMRTRGRRSYSACRTALTAGGVIARSGVIVRPELVEAHVGQVAGTGPAGDGGGRLLELGPPLGPVVLEPGRDRERERSGRFQRLEGRAGQQVVVERAILPRTGHPDVAGPEPLAQFGEGAQLVGRAIDAVRPQHEPAPAPGHEPQRRRGGQLAPARGVGGANAVERGHQVLHRSRPLERKGVQQQGSEHPDGLCHIAVRRARSVGTSGIVRPLRLRSATSPSPQRAARGAFGLR